MSISIKSDSLKERFTSHEPPLSLQEVQDPRSSDDAFRQEMQEAANKAIEGLEAESDDEDVLISSLKA